MSNRTKQVQFRMPEELHTDLKAALAYDKSSFADFFNKAAESYLSERNTDRQKNVTDRQKKIIDNSGEAKNG